MTPLATLASIVALGMSANTDNLTVGAAYGLRNVRISIGSNLLIAVLTTAAALLALAAGRGLRGLMPPAIPDIASGMMLILLGLTSVWLDRQKRGQQTEVHPPAKAAGASIGLRETLVLASALSINNIGLAFAGGVGGLGYAAVALSVAFFSVVFLWLGTWLSKTLAGRAPSLARRLPFDGNVLVMGVGVLIMVGL
jgi:putative Mn2+ efflux pump MntP